MPFTLREAQKSVWLGLAAVLLSWLIFPGIVLGIPGLQYGRSALRQSKGQSGGKKIRRWAILGIILNTLALVIALALLVLSVIFLAILML